MKFAFYTLGCKVNQFETQAMQSLCLERGHELVDFSSPADVYIINTCTVTSSGDHKSRQAAGRARKQSPLALVALCGCYSEVSPDEAKARTGADIVWGNRSHKDFLAAIEGLAEPRYVPGPGFELLPSGGLEGRTRALLKVQDGCDNYCSYCKIPYARGHIRSLPLEAAAKEAKRLSQMGYLEIVITGIEISSYGKGQGEKGDISELIETVCREAFPARVRLGSLYPDTITEDFCKRMAELENLCRHFHPSLQNGSARVLEAMNRRYSPEFFLERLELLKKYMPDCTVTTDLICGFPGETDGDFAETLELLEKARFLNVHIFPYSKRKGTRAASLLCQVPKDISRERCTLARALVKGIRSDILKSCEGKSFEVLFESREGGTISGYSREYLPFSIDFEEGLENSLCRVVAGRVKNGSLSLRDKERTNNGV